MKNILAITPYPNRSADTRYRITQFIPSLKQAGWNVDLRPLMDETLFGIYNKKGHSIEKVCRTLIRTAMRILDCLKAGQYDLIFLHKEAFPFGPPLLEKLIHYYQPRIIYDMDDAFWSHPPQLHQIGRTIRDPNRIAKIIQLSSHVLAGNAYLAGYAQKYNTQVTIFPTVLDTYRYLPRVEVDDGLITIGWVGRWSSSPYLNLLMPVFKQILDQYSNVSFHFVGAQPVGELKHERFHFIPWSLQGEISDISAFDIGIMPLPDDIYSIGKCGFKLLQYMALGIPAVASPVGVNKDIVQDGVNGFMASTEVEWLDRLTSLIKNYKYRRKLGLAARQTVENFYSLDKAVPKLLQMMNKL